jgi:integrase/recombinase XerD
LPDLQAFIESWFLEGEARGLSPRTIDNRRMVAAKILWWLEREEAIEVGVPQLRGFLAYLQRGHLEPEGRWGDSTRTRPLRPAGARFYHAYLSSLFSFIAAEGAVPYSPMLRVEAPRVPAERVTPFSEEQVRKLLETARGTLYGRRDYALIYFLFDTGARVSEACDLTWADLSLSARTVCLLGKGNKRRSIGFGADCARALWAYRRARPSGQEDPVFVSERGGALTRSGMKKIIKRISAAAGIEGVRCCPHDLRHAFSIEYIRGGGDWASLQQILGHTSPHQSLHYARLAGVDVLTRHRQYSPGDRLRKSRR